MRLRLTAVILASLAAAPAAAQPPVAGRAAEQSAAQARWDSLRARAGSDSAAHVRVLEHLYGLLTTALVRASLDTVAQAWEFRLPADDPPSRRVAAHLAVALRARAPVASDTAVWTLTLSPVAVQRDTARATVTLDYERRCGPGSRPGGWSNRHAVLVVRTPNEGWGQARTGELRVGDRFECRPPR